MGRIRWLYIKKYKTLIRGEDIVAFTEVTAGVMLYTKGGEFALEDMSFEWLKDLVRATREDIILWEE